jgi:carbamoyltransferase
MNAAYLGTSVDDVTHQADIEAAGLSIEMQKRDQLIESAASLLAAQRIIGWFQGRMEFRPLTGNCPILEAAFPASVKDTINTRVKHRQHFCPFVPSLPTERFGEFFEYDYISQFMLMVYKARAEKRTAIPALGHVDGTDSMQPLWRGRSAVLVSNRPLWRKDLGFDPAQHVA